MGISIQKSIYKKILKNLATEPFSVTFWDDSVVNYNDGVAKFHLIFNKPLNKKLLKTNPMIALAEGYMDKDIEVNGDLEYYGIHFFTTKKFYK